MKKNIILSIAFVLFILLINFGLDQFYKRVIMKNSIYNISDREFANFKKPINILFLGDSHMMYDIDTRAIDSNSFNYASMGENYFKTYYKLKKIIAEGRIPKRIAISAGLHSFSTADYTHEMHNDNYWVNYIQYPELISISHQYKFFFQWMDGRFYSYAGNYSLIIEHFTNKEKSKVINGHFVISKSFTDTKNQQSSIEDRINTHFKDGEHISNTKDTLLTIYFEKILELCKQNQIGVIVIKMPVTKGYYDEALKYVKPEEYDNNLNGAINKIYKGVRVIDCHALYQDNLSFFNDPDHLNQTGAMAFSKNLADSLKPAYAGLK